MEQGTLSKRSAGHGKQTLPHKLFYNDHGIEVTGKKSQALLNMLKDFVSRGVPIDGVGLEMHVDTTTNYPATFPAALKAYTDLGLEVHITEMDVSLPVNAAGVASAADLQAQANTYSFIVKHLLAKPAFVLQYRLGVSLTSGLGFLKKIRLWCRTTIRQKLRAKARLQFDIKKSSNSSAIAGYCDRDVG